MSNCKWNKWDELDEWKFLLGCLQESAGAELAMMGSAATTSTVGNVESSTTNTTATTTGPSIVQGVK